MTTARGIVPLMDLIDIARVKIRLVVRSMARTIVPNIAINLSMEAIIVNTDWRPSFSGSFIVTYSCLRQMYK